MATIFSLGQQGAVFKVKVIDIVEDMPFNPNSFASQRIVFYKPNGIRFEKDAVLVLDPENPSESFVQYQNSNEDSILDLRGSWQYDAEVTLQTSDTVETSNRFNFWVS